MKKSIISIAACLSLAVMVFCSHFVFAEEQYRAVVSGQYIFEDGDKGGEQASYGLTGRFYFEPVKTDKHPYGEAAFLERIGSVYASVLWQDYKSGSWKGDGPVWSVGINAAKPGVPVAAELFYTRSSRDYHGPYSIDITADTFGVRTGYFITDTWVTGIQYAYTTWENEYEQYSPIFIRQQQYRLFTKYDYDLGQYRMLSLYATVGRFEEKNQGSTFSNIDESIQLDYYFTKSLSAGLGFLNSLGTEKSLEGQTYSAHIQYFFNSSISANIGFSWFDAKNNDQESWKTYNVSLSARF